MRFFFQNCHNWVHLKSAKIMTWEYQVNLRQHDPWRSAQRPAMPCLWISSPNLDQLPQDTQGWAWRVKLLKFGASNLTRTGNLEITCKVHHKDVGPIQSCALESFPTSEKPLVSHLHLDHRQGRFNMSETPSQAATLWVYLSLSEETESS